MLVPGLANPRMALSAHVAGLIMGVLVLVLGLAWKQLVLSPRSSALTAHLLVGSLYLNLLALVLAAIFGTGRSTPIAGAGFEGAAWQELVVSSGLNLSALGAFVATLLLVIGFARRP